MRSLIALKRLGLFGLLLVLVVLWTYAALVLILGIVAGTETVIGRMLCAPFEWVDHMLHGVGEALMNSSPGGPKELAQLDDEALLALRGCSHQIWLEQVRLRATDSYLTALMDRFQQYDDICKQRGLDTSSMTDKEAATIVAQRPQLSRILE